MTNARNAPLMLSVSGCRGVTGASFTPDVAARFTGAFAAHLHETTDAARTPGGAVVFGRDGRAGASALRVGAIAGLLASGFDVIDVGVAATPTVGVMVEHHDALAGVVLTASHNPAQWNGLKCLVRTGSERRAAAPPAAAAARIIGLYSKNAARAASLDAQGQLRADDTGAHVHVARVLKAVERVAPIERVRERRYRVVVDSVNASGARAARLLLDALGCDARFINADESGVFPHAPEPTRENLTNLCSQTKRAGAHVGFAQDPDADRLALVDESGAYIGEEYTLALAARAVLDAGLGAAPRTLCANLSTSRMIDDVAAAGGARVVRTPVGEANVVEAMLREGSVLGGEGNGGVIWPDVTMIRDSVGAMALTLALLTRTGKPLGELTRDFPAYVIEKRKVDLGAINPARACAAIAHAFAAERVDTQDGVRVDIDPGGSNAAWLHVRPSNTEPILRLIAEARTLDRARELLDRAAALVENG